MTGHFVLKAFSSLMTSVVDARRQGSTVHMAVYSVKQDFQILHVYEKENIHTKNMANPINWKDLINSHL